MIRGGSLKAFSNTLPFTDGPHDLLILKFPLDSPGGVFLAGVGIDVTERKEHPRAGPAGHGHRAGHRVGDDRQPATPGSPT